MNGATITRPSSEQAGSEDARAVSAAETTVLTLTYGERVDLLSRMIEAVTDQGVRHIFVFANGLRKDVYDQIETLSRDLSKQGVDLRLFPHDINTGSALGYARLLTAAREDTATGAVWLLDDDNQPLPGALSALLDANARRPGAALASVRLDRGYLIEAARTGHAPGPSRGQAFHVDIFRKFSRLLSKLGLMRVARPGGVGPEVPITRVPYGGLFVPDSLLAQVAPPREDFVLYADDYEYSERLARATGLYLVAGAKVDDLETSWNATGKSEQASKSQFERLATMPPDFRLYYSVRNAIYLDRARVSGVTLLAFWINAVVLLSVGMLRAFAVGRPDNAHALRVAVCDGVSGRLGRNPAFPLP
ncbi:glycosyltransferase [Tropicimonas sp. TH_r6]|uniref:glycosyltransferase n=1 Tax=Tropicimonas sp. TH_r6 TaxID=3082085 RepID=UPI0029532D11|nr:glycosyltransferase [Tropicimonas sp. TH_r6]MDV7145533.1 glycosyltransferase [Tropicimonas sp. TH_r6]